MHKYLPLTTLKGPAPCAPVGPRAPGACAGFPRGTPGRESFIAVNGIDFLPYIR